MLFIPLRQALRKRWSLATESGAAVNLSSSPTVSLGLGVYPWNMRRHDACES